MNTCCRRVWGGGSLAVMTGVEGDQGNGCESGEPPNGCRSGTSFARSAHTIPIDRTGLVNESSAAETEAETTALRLRRITSATAVRSTTAAAIERTVTIHVESRCGDACWNDCWGGTPSLISSCRSLGRAENQPPTWFVGPRRLPWPLYDIGTGMRVSRSESGDPAAVISRCLRSMSLRVGAIIHSPTRPKARPTR
jgi:hypothetical protein